MTMTSPVAVTVDVRLLSTPTRGPNDFGKRNILSITRHLLSEESGGQPSARMLKYCSSGVISISGSLQSGVIVSRFIASIDVVLKYDSAVKEAETLCARFV